jgi:hypothetical protein
MIFQYLQGIVAVAPLLPAVLPQGVYLTQFRWDSRGKGEKFGLNG